MADWISSLFLGDPTSGSSGDINYSQSPVFADPVAVPYANDNGSSVYNDQHGALDGSIPASTMKDFYPESPTPNATGSNVVTIAGQKYTVTPDNYSKLARMYIDYRRSLGDKSYDDPTPNVTTNGSPTTAGNNRTIALIGAYQQLARLSPTNWSVDPLTGTAQANTSAFLNLLNNPIVKTSDAISNAGTSIFNAGNAVVQGGARTVTDTAGVLQTIGTFLSAPGTILIIGAGIGLFFLVKKKVI